MSDLAPHTTGGRAAASWAEQGLALLGEALCRDGASARVFVAAWLSAAQEELTAVQAAPCERESGNVLP